MVGSKFRPFIKVKKFLYLFLSILILFSGCAVNPVSGDQDFVLMSESQEIALGRNYSSQILKQIPAYPDKELQDYVQSVGDSLAKKSHRPNLIYRFTVLDSPDVNAFALPGGYIFVFRGLMAYLSSEEELAAVLGHELGHVTARHSVQQISQSQLFDVLTTVVGRQSSSNIYNITNLAKSAFLAGYGRKLELQADELGAEYLVKDGYSSAGMLETLSVLKDQEIYSKEKSKRRGQQQTYHGVFSSHPSNDKRFQEVITKAQKLEVNITKDPQGNYMKYMDNMIYGDNEASGVRRGRDFYHQDLDIHLKAPEKWEIENTISSLFFYSQNGEASLSVQVDDQNMRETPKDYLYRNISSNLSEVEDFLLGGYEACTAILERSGKRFRIAVIFKDKKIFQFLGNLNSSEENFFNYDKDFLYIVKSFSKLKESERSLALPLRIKLHKVKKGQSYNSLANASLIPNDPEKKLRLLNGDYPNGTLSAGRLIKIIK